MFYVVRKGEPLENYHSAFPLESDARKYAENLKVAHRHNYDVIKVSTVWTTQTLADLKAEGAF